MMTRVTPCLPPCKMRVFYRVEDKSILVAHAASDANFSLRRACTRISRGSDFISLRIRLDFISVPTVATGSEDCDIDTARALFCVRLCARPLHRS